MEICSFNINAFNGMKEKEKHERQVCNLKKSKNTLNFFYLKKIIYSFYKKFLLKKRKNQMRILCSANF